jgi:2,4-dienoyl-CoA reductase (NADPH2)
MTNSVIFTSLTINGVRFENRILRSSVGGRSCNYDGTVTDVWKNFESIFAEGGVGGIISTTFHVNKARLSPLQYPSIADDMYVPYLKKYIAQIKKHGKYDCKYIVQIGDPGYTTYTSLFPEERDAMSSSAGFDFAFGYNNCRQMMSDDDVKGSIAEYAAAAGRVKVAGADGVEITATKGYLIHQFLNPGINRRADKWGGDADRRFQFLKEIVEEVRKKVGPGFLLGIRLSGADYNYSPLLLALTRWPPQFLSRERWMGNDLPQMLDYAQRLEKLGVDYLHVVSGYGFPNPRDVPGEFPFDEIRMFFDSVRHLSCKAAARAALVHILPTFIGRWLFNLGWRRRPAVNLDFARAFREIGLPVIANGGFQERDLVEQAIDSKDCDMVSMARALIANPCLVKDFEDGKNAPAKPCSHCNKCVGRTTTGPLGCYDERRFASRDAMVKQIMGWNHPDPP